MAACAVASCVSAGASRPGLARRAGKATSSYAIAGCGGRPTRKGRLVAVYVDSERNRFGRMIMCHMFADTLAELHFMAEAIGMRRVWFQPLSFPHYDVSLARRAEAISYGAIEVTRRQGYEIRKRIRAVGWTQAELAELRAAIKS